MKTENEYLSLIDPKLAKKVKPIFDYINQEYPNAIYCDSYGRNSKLPGYRIDADYIFIGGMKNYMTIHFSNRQAIKSIIDRYPYCKANEDCVNFSLSRQLPYIILYSAIDLVFDK